MLTISDFIVSRLRDLGIHYAFGVAGDFVMPFLDHINSASSISFVPCANEVSLLFFCGFFSHV